MASRLILAGLALRRLGSSHSHAKFPFARIPTISCFIVIWLATTGRLGLDQISHTVYAHSRSFMREGLNCIVRLVGSRTELASERNRHVQAVPAIMARKTLLEPVRSDSQAKACPALVRAESLSSLILCRHCIVCCGVGKVLLFLTLASDAARPVRISLQRCCAAEKKGKARHWARQSHGKAP